MAQFASRKFVVAVLAMVLLVLDGTRVIDLGSARAELTTVVVTYIVGQGAVDIAATRKAST